MPKRARSASTATLSNVGTYDALLPTKRRACSTPLRSPPLPAADEPRGCALPLTLDNLTQHTRSCESQPAPRANLMTIMPMSLPPMPSSNYSECEPEKRENKPQRVDDNGLNG
ncbi:hypothetical protein A1F94_013601 [Pyrenophora tritici-repentis]|uniref:Uncharacterized protein n=2 Tax=Pyrenophora tritici-repentis TaxID=45151 RepID=A0A2W1CSV0_9PLEO|nr:uncharacterized protein PTRG_11732 [Pyrenophora tritici-repentis Pt-1C-BFP]KAF7573906.1 hypothetical protein PtrM4_055290 [Pyrenophora tritici-repentis]EDU44782.1 predicted protein [Pyrenophora tritici-repentis Pt-1C-BFP]KAG9375857.1 hypothetical protein A1F94_013601 [Pyrenophora tritici-repentis]KAI0570343.1 hypothetical protein Alg215_11113 [Pyrenophora tritici-repentis]KAI0573436.1 hypothetical protein Alg130_10092 [Pyrenophora tritici-repentis]